MYRQDCGRGTDTPAVLGGGRKQGGDHCSGTTEPRAVLQLSNAEEFGMDSWDTPTPARDRAGSPGGAAAENTTAGKKFSLFDVLHQPGSELSLLHAAQDRVPHRRPRCQG